LRSLPFFNHFILQTGNWQPQRVLGCQFPPRNAKWLKNGKLRKAILFAFYNISQRNFGILLILWCSFKLWWNFCLDLLRSKFSLLRKWSIGRSELIGRQFQSLSIVFVRAVCKECAEISCFDFALWFYKMITWLAIWSVREMVLKLFIRSP
jgi:hypothetical protein